MEGGSVGHTMTLPLLKLPLLVLRKILKQFEIGQIIIISISSKKAEEIFQEVNLKIGYIRYSVTTGQIIISSQKSHSISWSDHFPKCLNISYELYYVNDGKFCGIVSKCPKKLDHLLSTIFSVLPNASSEVFCDLDAGNEFSFIWKFPWTTCRYTCVEESQIPRDSIQNILENGNLEEADLWFPEESFPGFKYTGKLKPKLVHIRNCSWLSLNSTLNTTCETVYLKRSLISGAEINDFLKNWMKSGETSKLAMLDVWGGVVEDLEDVDNGFKIFDWRKRPEKFRGYSILGDSTDSTVIFEICREDGAIATVRIEQSRGFTFYSWINEGSYFLCLK